MKSRFKVDETVLSEYPPAMYKIDIAPVDHASVFEAKFIKLEAFAKEGREVLQAHQGVFAEVPK